MPEAAAAIPFPSEDQTALERIIYISLPENIEKKLEGFELDPAVPLPVEPPPGMDGPALESLSWEMIVSAMLKIFAWQPEHPHIGYFRGFINAVQPGLVEELTAAAIRKADDQQFDIAEELFRALVNLAPEQENTFLNLGTVFEEQAALLREEDREEEMEDYYQLALSVYRRGIQFHPGSAGLHFNAGHFFLQRNNIQKTKEHFTSFLRLETEKSERRAQVEKALQEIDARFHDDLTFTEAFDFIRMGQEEKGITRVRRFLEKNPNVWNAWFLLGWGLRKKGDYRDASEAFRRSIELKDTNPDTFNELAICNLELREYREAESNLKSALKLEPENTKVISNLGILALKEGDKELAKAYFLTVLEYDAEDPVATQYLDKLGHET